MRKLILLVLGLMIIQLVGCSNISKSKDDKQDHSESHVEVVDSETKVDKLLKGMSLEDKISQLFILSTLNISDDIESGKATEYMKDILSKYQISGVILFSRDIKNQEQLETLVKEINSSLRIKPFISVDEEGGRVARLYKNGQLGMPNIPKASVIGERDDVDYAYGVGKKLGQNLFRLGFNMDFAPVLDVNTNPNNPVIGDRSLSSNPRSVARLGVKEAEGMASTGVIPVVKHFPGHGDTSTDSHLDFAYLNHDEKRLEEIELLPFKEAIDSNLPVIMIGHISVPKIAGDNTPASLSQTMIEEYLIGRMGFDGVIITDALDMGAISKNYSSSEVGIKAIDAGIDILLMPKDFEKTYNSILKAVKSGRISMDRIDRSVRKILTLKYNYNLLD